MDIDVVMNGGRVVERVAVNMPSHVTINGGEGGGGTGEVSSVNGKKGVVVLTAADVGADPAGTATAAVGAHVAVPDPHGDRSYTDGQVSALADATAAALSTKASTSDPRLSDPRTPTPHQHPWTDVTGKPTTYNPSAHTHTWSEVTGKPSTFPPEAHTQDWSTVTGKPSSFTPASHTHPLSEVSDFPAPDAVGNVLTSTGSGWASQAPSGGGGGGVWQEVSTQTLASNTAAISFTDLHLWSEIEIRWSGRGTSNDAQALFLLIQFNGDSAANYERATLYRQSSTVAVNESAQTAGWVGRISGAQVNSNRRATGTVYVSCDQPAAERKTARGEFACLGSTSTQVAVGDAGTGWSNDTDPITSVTLSTSSGMFAAGTKFTVLGRH